MSNLYWCALCGYNGPDANHKHPDHPTTITYSPTSTAADSGHVCQFELAPPSISFKPRPVPAAPTGIKHDQDKPDMSLLSNIALIKVAQVMTYGKSKYSAHNWRGGFIWSRPLAAAARHLFAYIGGEDKDPETGLSHLAHCACCLFFILEFEETKRELDDRFKGESK